MKIEFGTRRFDPRSAFTFTKMIKNEGFPFSVYALLYRSCVISVSDYSSAVVGYSEYSSSEKLQLRAIRAFLGVPKNARNAGVLTEVGWLLPKFQTRHVITIDC